MSTKQSNRVENIRSEFQKLFEKSPEEHVEDRAQMLSYMFLSEAQKTMDRKGWTRKRLADEIGTSASYLTQLFRGDRLLNFKTVAKIEVALGFRFEVNVDSSAEGFIEYSEKEDVELEQPQVNES
ncbi:XRE family transcriptional regulator [Rhodohalobacter sp. SW132]|uniref:helix-turn-helix domain-containing protein n=1 Tax=Rhodohalobacter sp. SW132 TaxID=2293433 RepID=UPI000E244999|nr:helix-turn-helix transcriptional regulator [Rhodohalobacter sp. SW132]REL24560.1 XRE family transcriptional regulator [Rhodohalobacter sp. SW132]